MDQIGEHHHQFDSQFRPVDNISPAAFQSLDTVRALHQTVVSLRTALEAAQREIDTLKRQVIVTTDIRDGKAYYEQDRGIIETIADGAPSITDTATEATITDIDLGQEETVQIGRVPTNNIVKNSSRVKHKGSVISNVEGATAESEPAESIECHGDSKGKDVNAAHATPRSQRRLKSYGTQSQRFVNVEEIQVIEKVGGTKKTDTSNIKVIAHPKHSIRKQMASKIDVKIRLSSDIKVNGSSSEASSDTNSGNYLIEFKQTR